MSTFMQDGVAGHLLGQWGADNFVFSNDYPHAGGIWPYSDDTVELTLHNVPEETVAKVMGGNLARWYNQPLPPAMERIDPPEYDPADVIWNRHWLKKAGEFSFDDTRLGFTV